MPGIQIHKHNFFRIIVFLFIVLSISQSRADERDDLLKELDRKVEQRQYYMDIKENRIDSLRKLLHPGQFAPERYSINNMIYNEYNTYHCDSAMRYVFHNRELADSMDIQKYKDEVMIHLSMLLSTTGMFRESIDNLKGIDRAKLDNSLLDDYYSVSEWTYYAAGEYTNDSLYAPQYRQMELLYMDSVLSVLPENTIRSVYYKGKKMVREGKLEEALAIFQKLYPTLPVNTRLYAIVTFDIAFIYKRFGNMDLYEQFLILAAISDLVCPLKENLAMQELAIYLYQNKPADLDRAYRYIQCSLEDARFYNNRLRIVQISEKMPVIINAYQQKSQKEKNLMMNALVVISILSLLTVLLLFYTYKQIRMIRKNRYELKQLNEDLHVLNEQLHEANHTREEYIGLFMDLCSTYIDKLDKYRVMVKLKVTAKQFDDLYRLVNSTRTIEMELDDFFRNFDTAFLKLYPTFIQDFNKLLQEGEAILPKKGELLNRELRIFALIRIGINDSSKIASFLRYSPQTIYNNRTRVRNKAKNRTDFEKDILNIGNYDLNMQA